MSRQSHSLPRSLSTDKDIEEFIQTHGRRPRKAAGDEWERRLGTRLSNRINNDPEFRQRLAALFPEPMKARRRDAQGHKAAILQFFYTNHRLPTLRRSAPEEERFLAARMAEYTRLTSTSLDPWFALVIETIRVQCQGYEAEALKR